MNESLNKIIECLSKRKSFLLEAGAGSGKTWSLIESLKYLLTEHQDDLEANDAQVVCITYTNVAKDEISERIDNHPLVKVGTIHEFLWDIIKNFQTALKSIIIEENKNSRKKIEGLEEMLQEVQIEYSMYGKRIEKGKIGHNEVIKFSSTLFSSYPKIATIVASQYPFIFIDEYQDTESRTVELLTKDLLKPNKGTITLGFFGDSMQKIYNQGIGKIEDEGLTLITKKENFRCSIKVIELLNKMRQIPQQEPCGSNKEGVIRFLFSENDEGNNDYQKVVSYLKDQCKWNMEASKQLFLTHKGIAEQLDYSALLALYTKRAFGRERLYGKEEAFSDFFLSKVEFLLSLYKEKRYSEFIEMLGKEDFKLNYHSDKQKIKDAIDGLKEIRKTGSVREVYDYVNQNKLVRKTAKVLFLEEKIKREDLDERVEKDRIFYNTLMDIQYKEFIALNNYLQENTPFSTKHGVKGAEYENVLVVMDDKAWNQYSFDEVFSDNRDKSKRYERTKNLLYVSCSRAKNELTLFMQSSLSSQSIDKIKEWFGEENVQSITRLV